MKITLPTAQSTVEVTKLLCIGRNYAKHAAEMKSDVPDEPLVFLKPPSALVGDEEAVVLPAASRDVHHEVELVAVIGTGGKNIPPAEALNHVDAYAVGLDMTARDLQSEAKKGGRPWSVAKGFDTFAPLGPREAAASIADPQDLTIRLTVNGEERQAASTKDMIFPVAELIAYCSRIFTLAPGDLIYTGTPEGVGPVHDGDVLEATVSGLPPLRVRVQRAGEE
jgi:2-keto-4-pentenoate hydratase/2-oxohepta-3-ene-1,7-dioic acid hydratase in catechol pathway